MSSHSSDDCTNTSATITSTTTTAASENGYEMDMSHADRMDTSSRTSSSPVFFYSPRVPRKQQQQQQLALHQHHSSRLTNPHVASPLPDESLCDTRFQSTRPSTITLTTFAADRKTAGQQTTRRNGTKDCWSIRRAECVPLLLQEPDNSCDKIAMSSSGTTNHDTHAVCDDDCRILVPNPLPSSSSSSGGSDARNKPQQQPLLSLDQMSCKKNNTSETLDQRQSHSPSISSSAQTAGSPVSRSSNALLCPELEHEMEKLDSLIDYINSGLEALVNDDEENRVVTSGQGCDCNQSVNAGLLPAAAAGVTSHSVSNKSRESLINHCKDQQEPIPSLTTTSTCDRLKFCVKSLHDSADTVIDGSSSKDVSSSADGCSEHDDGLSKEDVTVTSDDDELVDEGFQCNSADQMIPFNHLTVLQIEAFLKKHRVSHDSNVMILHDDGTQTPLAICLMSIPRDEPSFDSVSTLVIIVILMILMMIRLPLFFEHISAFEFMRHHITRDHSLPLLPSDL